MPALILDLNTLYRIMLPEHATEQAAIFWYEKNQNFIFIGYKGPLTLKAIVSEKDIVDMFSNYYAQENVTGIYSQALQRFSEVYLNRAIKIEGEEEDKLNSGGEFYG